MAVLKHIYLVRHGQTQLNKEGIVQGSGIDAPLNKYGERQARAFYNAYQTLPLDCIYVSELQRSKQSVQHFINDGIRFERHHGLNEISWGVHEGKPFTGSSHADYLKLQRDWKDGLTHLGLPRGESPEQVATRQQPILRKIEARTEEKHILICMHGRAMRILLCQLQGLPLSQMDEFEHNNLGLYHLSYSVEGGYELILRNSQQHLLDISDSYE